MLQSRSSPSPPVAKRTRSWTDDELPPVLDEYAYGLAKFPVPRVNEKTFQRRRNEFYLWVFSGDFHHISEWVEGSRSPGSGNPAGSTKQDRSEENAVLLREVLEADQITLEKQLQDPRVPSGLEQSTRTRREVKEEVWTPNSNPLRGAGVYPIKRYARSLHLRFPEHARTCRWVTSRTIHHDHTMGGKVNMEHEYICI